MSVNPLLLPVKKDAETIRKTVLTNIIKMYCNRSWIKRENLEKQIKQITEMHNDNHVYKITLDVDLRETDTYYPVDEGEERNFEKDFNGTIAMVKLSPIKLPSASMSKYPIIQEFIDDNANYHRILIVDSISDKAKAQITTKKHIEVFTEEFLMADLLEHDCSPKYEILRPSEMEPFLESYHLTRRQMKKMFANGKEAQYLFLKKKQIVRIIRDSEQTGSSVDYRLVIHRG